MYQCASWHTGVDFNDFLMSSPEARARPGKTKWSKLTKAVHSLFLVSGVFLRQVHKLQEAGKAQNGQRAKTRCTCSLLIPLLAKSHSVDFKKREVNVFWDRFNLQCMKK